MPYFRTFWHYLILLYCIRNDIPGIQFFVLESQEIELDSTPLPERIQSCEASLDKFRFSKKKAKLVLYFGADVKLSFRLKEFNGKWYTYWMMSKRYIEFGEEMRVERTVNRFTYGGNRGRRKEY